MTRSRSSRTLVVRATLAGLALAALSAILPVGLAAQQAPAKPTAATYVKRAGAAAARVDANVARADSVGMSSTEPAAATTPAATSAPDSAAAEPAPAPAPVVAPTPVKRREASAPLSFDREVYSYAPAGRRDPFKSLVATGGDLRPMISDLKLVAIAYDASGGSVAVLRDLGTNEQYRVRTGQQLGRMRVASIMPRKVVFTIEEFGFSRQESLVLGDLTNARTQQ